MYLKRSLALFVSAVLIWGTTVPYAGADALATPIAETQDGAEEVPAATVPETDAADTPTEAVPTEAVPTEAVPAEDVPTGEETSESTPEAAVTEAVPTPEITPEQTVTEAVQTPKSTEPAETPEGPTVQEAQTPAPLTSATPAVTTEAMADGFTDMAHRLQLDAAGVILAADTADLTQPCKIYIPKQAYNSSNELVDITGIGASAFAGNDIGEIQFAEDNVIASIGAEAFRANTHMTIRDGFVSDHLVSLGNSAFLGTAITAITLPTGFMTLGTAAFGATRLTSIVIPEGVSQIPSDCFGSSWLTSITLLSTLTSIGGGAFNSLGDLTIHNLPPTCTIGSSAFAWSRVRIDLSNQAPGDLDLSLALADAYFPFLTYNAASTSADSWWYINSDPGSPNYGLLGGLKAYNDPAMAAYRDSYPISTGGALEILASVNGVPVKTLGPALFANGTERTIRTVTFAAGSVVSKIGLSTFENSNLTSIALPESLEVLGANSFSRTTALVSITLPANVRTLENRAFASATRLREVIFEGSAVASIAANAFSSNSVLWDIYLEEMPQGSVSGAPWGSTIATVHWQDAEVVVPGVVLSEDGIWRYNELTGDIMSLQEISWSIADRLEIR
ncbi:MAG: leucine-rich repeat protein [Lachnospiraceae bacterium]